MRLIDFLSLKANNFKPLLIILIYLTLSLILFKFGPIKYVIHNEPEFWFYMIYYLITISLGYALGIKWHKFYSREKGVRLLKIPFNFFAVVAFIAALILNANLAKQETIIPFNLFRLISGQINFLDIGAVYYQRIESGADFEGSFFRNIFFTLIGWVRFVFVIYIFTFWPKLSKGRKVVGTIIIIIPVLTGISIGTNRSIFEPAILILLTAAHGLAISSYSKDLVSYTWNKKIIKVGSMFLLVAIIFFGAAMSGRGANNLYIESNSKLGDITIRSTSTDDNGFINTSYMLLHYVVQGYYGFSLSLSKDFDSTFGFGHSPFLLRQVERVTGENFGKSTYQAKIDPVWSEKRQWHTAYSQFANDVHFIGVGLILFCVSYIYSTAFCLAKKYRYREAIYLLPLLGLFFIFLPANNQVFGYIETLFAFLVLSFALHLRIRF